MNAAHTHLLLNHVPILGIAFALLLLAWSRWRGGDEVARAALALLVLVGAVGVFVSLSGEGAEEIVEELPGVEHDRIEAHEEAGKLAMWVGVALGLLSAAGLWIHRKTPIKKSFVWVALVAGLVTLGFFAYAGFQGGQIQHEEVRQVEAPLPPEAPPPILSA